MKYVIIGNGIAGVSAAEAVRASAPHDDIIMIADETFLPYSRPMISHVLDGSQPHKKLPIRSGSFYDDLKIQPLLGQRAGGLDVGNHKVILADGSSVDYDRLLIATGADPRALKAEGMDLANIFYLRTEAHVKQQLAALDGARQAVVLGGGLVGFKAAYGLLKRGLKVTMLITSDYPLSMQVDPITGTMILDELKRHGLTVKVGTSVTGFEGKGSVKAAITDEDSSIPCDLAIIGKGVLPVSNFIPRQEINVDLGVIVDEHLRSSAKDIFAAGDVAEMTDIARGRQWVNAIWPEAAAQGRVAGLNMTGRRVIYPGSLSRNVMRVFDLDVLTVGHTTPKEDEGCRIVQWGGPGLKEFRRLVLRHNILVGAVLVNNIDQGGVLRSLIQNRTAINMAAEKLVMPGFNFGKLL